nr:rep protein [Cressdnaviricota sp.]UOF78933.1 rep protein [Cressdnaviricota sp.]
MSQGIYWLLTIPYNEFTPFIPNSVRYIRGQLESGSESGYLHWQLLVAFFNKCRLAHVQSTFGRGIHAELSRSSAANSYVWKDETRIEGTQFELGNLATNRNNKTDWEAIRGNAIGGRLDLIPSDVFVRYYQSLRRIVTDNLEAVGMERTVKCFWGASATGKSRRAWEEATFGAYPKDPRTKFWDGYRGQENIVIDEFRGGVDIGHLLRWLDRYPVIVEVKGSSTVLKAKNIWITSNLHPNFWYPFLDPVTLIALTRRMEIIEFK